MKILFIINICVLFIGLSFMAVLAYFVRDLATENQQNKQRLEMVVEQKNMWEFEARECRRQQIDIGK